jgi:tetratricopeptide (TPR) repeat protein
MGIAVLAVIASMPALVSPLSAQETQSAKAALAALRGTVRSRAGSPVRNARVTLQQNGSSTPRETSTDAEGRFQFDGIAKGSFTLTASSEGIRSAPVSVLVSAQSAAQEITLVLGISAAKPSAAAQANSGKAMQFADDPDFKVAAVTDWTAAGGHGSDVALRTSEALTRQTMKLNPGNTGTAAGGLPGHAGNPKETETELRAAVAKDPKGFGANRRLGQFYLETDREADAISPLQAAYRADPANYDNEYDLARALIATGETTQAREHIHRLHAHRPSGNLHRLQGELDEKLGDPLSAVQEFREAASEDPSEDNYFAWGSELLYHRAIWQAKEVFDEGVKLYPNSARMLTARGAALFAVAMYDQAALDLCRASDLNPLSAEPYLFMGKIEVVAPDPLPCVLEKLARFEKLQPSNSLANYYYAMALWKQEGSTANSPQTMERVKSMLTRAVTLDPKCADGYLQLGNLSAARKQWEQAIGLYQKAIEANPELIDAHYRLGVAYERTGEHVKAQEQFQLHDSIAREQAAEIQRQRKAVKQFMVVAPGQAANQ